MNQATKLLQFFTKKAFYALAVLLLVCNLNIATAQSIKLPCYATTKSQLLGFLKDVKKDRTKVVICPFFEGEKLKSVSSLKLYLLNKASGDEDDGTINFQPLPLSIGKAPKHASLSISLSLPFVISNCEFKAQQLKEAISDTTIAGNALIYFQPTLTQIKGPANDGLMHLNYIICYIKSGMVGQSISLTLTQLINPNPSPPAKPGEYK
jgi:hypothetical protein